jgi:prevent-host-death family protein
MSNKTIKVTSQNMRENLKLVLDRVEKDGQLYEITRLGKPVAIISPVPKKRLDK